ncbi:MAG: aminoacyl-tRNA deacylase [Bacteroidales bacterium]|nr:aminoacyl-tRNA deacylase [Bacteroidales bacterium]
MVSGLVGLDDDAGHHEGGAAQLEEVVGGADLVHGQDVAEDFAEQAFRVVGGLHVFVVGGLDDRSGQCLAVHLLVLVQRDDIDLHRTGLFVCVIPGAEEVDLKKAAKVTGNKKVEMIHVKELLPLTGYIRGGCSPIGMKKPLPTWFHQTLTDYDTVYCSAGQRGLQFRLAPQELVRAAKGTLADLIV